MAYPIHALRDGSGFIHACLAGEGLPKKKLVYMDDDGKWRLANAELMKKHKAVAITVDRIQQTRVGRIALPPCFIGSDDWNFEPKAIIYASDVPGELSVEPGMYEVVVGQAYENDLIWFVPGILPVTLFSDPPVGDNFKIVTNLYIELIDGKPKLKVVWEDGVL